MLGLTVLSLGPGNSRTTLTAYRLQESPEGAVLVAAALHVDMAEGEADGQLVAVLGKLLTSLALDEEPAPTPVSLLQTMHQEALLTGRYFSAATAISRGQDVQVARCGLAAVQELPSKRVVLPTESLVAGQKSVVTNALGARNFGKPTEASIRLSTGVLLISVGGTLLLAAADPLTGLNPAPEVPDERGGIVVSVA